ncbi:MAG: hypothetical protein A3F54_03330 [Candidatus Kerfeldbacteria bacterium RIFCSPHIGHO2_12_FULL_48_17]|uniref:Uncharacterized protein n=1 Tax=Candidatus Kerfeldbacteria bacterium RIFCSPHIGHO2_12_FULL_48_17 TaxID=1798542 RepID=A0A1G2B6F2_9BACT|nr:MAG: hypothetical protein A3F54_03330 [Candidatus Kerfeldbacteria bacterium RIFCSPHIGHO2_12_FULL_48_17]
MPYKPAAVNLAEKSVNMKYSDLADALGAVSEHMDDYKNILTDAPFVAGENKDISLDVFLQHSLDIGNKIPATLEDVEADQLAMKRFFQEATYAVISQAGSSLERYTFESLAQKMALAAEQKGDGMTPLQAVDFLSKNSSLDGVIGFLVYCRDMCGTTFIGAEDEHLLRLYLALLDYSPAGQDEATHLALLSGILLKVRTEIAIAKTLIVLRKAHAQKAAVVLGYSQEESVAAYLAKLSVKGGLYKF